LGGTEHQYSLGNVLLLFFPKRICWCWSLCVERTDCCNSSLRGLTDLRVSILHITCTPPSLAPRFVENVRNRNGAVAMPCHVYPSPLPSQSPSPSPYQYKNTPPLPPHPINPPAILPSLPLIRLPRRWLPPTRRLPHSLASGRVPPCCCSPIGVALMVAGCGFVLVPVLFCGGFDAQRVCGLFDGGHVEERGQAGCCCCCG
jgi:hypothetical protein